MCISFICQDAPSGVEAGLAAGMQVGAAFGGLPCMAIQLVETSRCVMCLTQTSAAALVDLHTAS